MNMQLTRVGSVLVAFCVACASLLSSGSTPAQQPENSIAALFDGLPGDLHAKVQNNSVRRDRVNDWLVDHVNGKGKTIEMQVPVRVLAKRAKDRTYLVAVTIGAGKGFVGGIGGKKGAKGGTGKGGAGKGGGGNAGGGNPGGSFAGNPGGGFAGNPGGGFAGNPGGGGGGQFGGLGGFGFPFGPKVTVLGDEWALDLIVGTKESADYWPNELELTDVSVADAEKLVDLTKATIKGKVQEVELVNALYLRVVLGDVLVDGKKMTPRKRELPAKAVPLQTPAK
jgi:hypothetical protein